MSEAPPPRANRASGPGAAPRALRIAWLGNAPLETGSAPGVATELLEGLAAMGHQIDCFFPGAGRFVSERLSEQENPTFIWGGSGWRWNRWYSKTALTAFVSGQLARGGSAIRLRREVARRHRERPYDLVFQNSTIESPGLPVSVARAIPVVIRPDTHIAGELRWLIAERRLALTGQPLARYLAIVAMMAARSLVQRVRIRRASLVICISRAFRDHLVHDYRVPPERTTVIGNPVRLDQFSVPTRPVGRPPTVLVLGRVALRKGIEDVVELARELERRGADARIRIVGGPSLWSDYTKLLADLPANAEYVGSVRFREIPAELAASDVLLQASKYEPFGLTVAEALASGVPVVATSEVGAIEDASDEVVAAVAPGDIGAMADALLATIARLERDPASLRDAARAEAERLFDADEVCRRISAALEAIV